MKKLLLATLVVSVFALTNLAEAKCNDGSCHREKSSCHSGSCGKSDDCRPKDTYEEDIADKPCCTEYVPVHTKPVKHEKRIVRYSCPPGKIVNPDGSLAEMKTEMTESNKTAKKDKKSNKKANKKSEKSDL